MVGLSAPISLPLGLAVAAAVRLTDGPPVLFKQERAGLDGRPFNVLKFRTMTNNRSVNGKLLPDRERLTTVGKFLRKTSLDELPQLLNILRREMSIVGPRPLYLSYVPHYTPRESLRLRALPGITGLAQVSGRNAAGWRDRLELDALYTEAPTLRKDLSILLKTVAKVVRSDGISVVAGDSGDPLDIERSFPSQGSLHLRRLYPRDLKLRVRWMSDKRVREHMNLPEDVTLESTENWYREIRHDPNRQEFVVEDDCGRVCAMTGLRSKKPGEPSEFYIFVAPDLQGLGIGRKATELTLKQAVRAGNIRSITLTVAKKNARALRIYEDLGFVTVDSSDDRLWMELELAKGDDNA